MRIAVIGGGTMGVGIAHRFAARGAVVSVVDVDLEAARSSVGRVAQTLITAADRGKLDPENLDGAVENLHATGSIEELPGGLDLIVEAVIEDVVLKQSILALAEARTPSVLASNTSSISIDELARGLTSPELFAGMHFFNPVWAMHLVEVIRGSATSQATLDTISSMVEYLGMEQALISDAAGFATSRLGVLVGIEAIRMVQEGVAEPEDIDRAEVHECFRMAEITHYEDLDFCKRGEGGRLVEDKVTWLGGKLPVNVSGGLLCKGHPLGATGPGQIYEIVKQLRGQGGKKQVEGARVGLHQPFPAGHAR